MPLEVDGLLEVLSNSLKQDNVGASLAPLDIFDASLTPLDVLGASLAPLDILGASFFFFFFFFHVTHLLQ